MKIKLEKFEGPLSLLLKLIEKEELDITQISLSKIADQYVEYIRNSSFIDPEELADFLLLAARLLLIKSKAMLPYLYPEEEAEIEDLERQLRIYKEFLDATKKVEIILGKKKFMFAREFNRKVALGNTSVFSPPKSLEKKEMAEVFKSLLIRIKPAEKLGEDKIETKVSIEDKISFIKNLIGTRIKMSFSKIFSQAKTKTEKIVSFLAMLELIKQKEIVAEQGSLFSEISLNKYKEIN
ncbi:MAG: segregation/condensation protein A [Patescibacteria group bacterium]|jgi:segregation and condensation protein A|nr:segregation/condensation protein A [Patescibacteria group bacterium]